MAVVDVGIVINARDQATATIGRVRSALNQLSGGSGGRGGGLSGVTAGFQGAGRSMFGFLSRMNTVAAAAFVVFHSIKTVALGLAQFAAETQRASQALIVTTGSIQNAQNQFQHLVETFGPAGFEIQSMTQNFNALRGAGLAVGDANRTLEATAAAISAFGGSQAQLDRAVVAISQIGAKGVAQMEELRGQLSEAIPIALAIMSDQAGISIREFMQRVKDGLVSSEEAIRLFTDGAEELFEGLLEAQRQTLTGAVSEMQNAVTVGLADVFQRTDLDERLIVMFHEVTESILGFFASIDQAKIDAFFDVMAQLGGVVESVLGVFGALGPLFDVLAQSLGPLIPLLLDLLKGLADFVALILGGALFAIFKLSEAFHNLAGNAQAAAQAQEAAAAAGRSIQRSTERLTSGRQTDPGLSDRDRNAQAAASLRIEASARRVAELQARQAAFNRASTQQSREQLRIQERISDLVAESNAQFSGSLLNFADNLDRVANRVADIFNMESLTYDVRRASADALRGMTSEQVRQAELARGMAAGLSTQLATIRANAVAVFTRSAAVFRNEMADALDEVRIAQLDAFSEIVGGSVEAAALRVELVYRRQARALEEQLEAARQLNARTGQEEDTIRTIEGLLASSNQLRLQAVEFARLSAEAARQEAIARAQIEASELRLQATQAQRANSDNPLTQGILGTQAGQMIERVEQERQRLFVTIADMQARLSELRARLPFADPETAKAIKEQINAISDLINVQSSAMGRLSESAILARELWQEVGRTIEQGVGDAIYGVVTGTQTLEDVGLQMFQALTRAAIDYLIQLYAIQIAKQAASFFGAANGAIAGGPVTKMAAGGTMIGGIIRGPTMFQAGEAGEEAIMPLTKINGKLGVAAVGAGGGDQFHINISAIDTQSGIEFLLKNRGVIMSSLRHEMFMNRGLDKVRP